MITRQGIENWINKWFAPKPKETLIEVSDKVAVFIGTYPPNERILILQNIESRILADLITERGEAELKVSERVKAINQLNK